MNSRFSFEAIGQSPPSREKIAAWMEQHGWQATNDNNSILFTGPEADDGERITRWVPCATASDYLIRVEDLLNTLSSMEERPAIAILQEMQSGLTEAIPPLSDVLRKAGVPLHEQLVSAISTSLEVRPETQRETEDLFAELGRIVSGAEPIDSEGSGRISEAAFKETALVCSRIARSSATRRSLAAVCQIMLELTTPLTRNELTRLWQAASSDDVQCPDQTLECLQRIDRERHQSKPPIVPQD